MYVMSGIQFCILNHTSSPIWNSATLFSPFILYRKSIYHLYKNFLYIFIKVSGPRQRANGGAASSSSRAIRVLLRGTPADDQKSRSGAITEFLIPCPPRRRGESESVGFEAVGAVVRKIFVFWWGQAQTRVVRQKWRIFPRDKIRENGNTV